ncbi:MAG: 30S ribosomal protein S8 [Acidobacteria bacterium]|jgi:small subunit ribosomal protein S8|nr:30S ribosomal protein S8 [Acidobacteriota bacterium]MBE3126456.1 30S ribosomal protein S8 [Acidobacteriota bacterium]MBE3129361.1 30S ribosomal protein S8 [Acidobacteriota bacterium]
MDSISDLLTRIRNGAKSKKREVNIPSCRLGVEVVKILREEGYVKNYKVIEDSKQGILNVTLKYTEDNKSVISGIKRVSKPGCRIYCTKDSVPKVLDGLGLVIVSTSRGVLTGRSCEELGAGGEVLCSIW